MIRGLLDLIKLSIILIVLAVIFHGMTFPILITGALRLALGAPVYVHSVKLDYLSTQVKVDGIQIKNPSGFPDGTLLNISKLFVDFEIASLWEGKVDIDTVEIECPDLRILRREDGKINLMALRPFEQMERKKSYDERQETKPDPRMTVNTLVVSLGYATFTDLSAPTPFQRTYDLKVDHAVFRNVTKFEDILKIFSWEALKRMNVPNLNNITSQLRDLPQKAEGGLLKRLFGPTTSSSK